MKTIAYFLFSIIVLVSCSTGPEFKRNNENDIASSSYIPDISELKLVISANKSVTLHWEDNSTNESGFFIWKKLGEEGEILLLDEVPTNTETYTDTSGKLDLKTRYFISAYTEGGAEVSPTSTNTLSALLDLGTLSEVSRTAHRNEITLRWDTSNIFADKYLIQQSTFDVSTIDTIDGSLSSYSFMENAEDYVRSYQVSALLQSHSGSYDVIDVLKYENVTFNLPTNLQVNIINEAQALVTFEDGSDFDDQFIIYERYKRGGCCNHTYSDYQVLDTLDSVSDTVFISRSQLSDREFSIQAITNKASSIRTATSEIELAFGNPVHFVENTSETVTVLSNTSIRIVWDITKNTSIDRYHQVLSIYDDDSGEPLQEIILSPDVDNYTLENLDPSVNYRITISSYQTNIWNSLILSNKITISENDEFYLSQGTGVSNLQFYQGHNYLSFTPSQIGIDGIRVYNLKTQTFRTIQDGAQENNSFKNSILENYTTSHDLSLSASFRTIFDDNNGSKETWIFLNDLTSGSNSYYQQQTPVSYYTEKAAPIGFTSDNEIIYLYHEPENYHDDNMIQIYKWNFESHVHQVIAEINMYTITGYFIDPVSNFVVLYNSSRLLKLDASGNIVSDIKFEGTDFNLDESVFTKADSKGHYYAICQQKLCEYSILTDTFKILSEREYFKSAVELPEHNSLLTYYRNSLIIFDKESWEETTLIPDYSNLREFRDGTYLPETDQVALHINGIITMYDLVSTWVANLRR